MIEKLQQRLQIFEILLIAAHTEFKYMRGDYRQN